MPITEYDRALRSHSVGPGDITAIESARNSFHTDYNFTRRRAATSIQLYPIARVKDGELAGLSPRPASTHARSSKILDDPEEIGRAISSDLGGLRRRSRSLSGLGGTGGLENGAPRRRSDEIRYWRESYDPDFASPLACNVPEADDGGTAAADTPVDAASSERPKSPPEPLNFGSIANINAMAGMRITHAANLDNQLGALEARMRRMEILIARVRNAVPEPESPVFGRGPPRSVPRASNATLAYPSSAPTDPPLYRSESRDEVPTVEYSNSRPSEDTQFSFDEASVFRGSLHPPPGSHTRRPTSNSTIRGATSLPMLSREANGPLTTDHYTTLLTLLETERSTRRALEDQVRRLTHTVDVLTKRSEAGILLDPPPTARSFGGQSAFDDDTTDDGNGGSERNTPRRKPPKLEDSGIAPGLEDTDDENAGETFLTPREERTLGFGAFGEELREDDEDGNRKKAARTLSLSQLTVAKGQR
ncbi:hypothetical protein IMZ48_06940 [Candidatus Bathyarchaeota archaeon]|nr:hypothetical protein [Candidatus Bathyarchaeota archaeon]